MNPLLEQSLFMKGNKREWTTVEKGFESVETGREDGCHELAPPVAKSCCERGNILWRTCEYLVTVAERSALFD